MIDNEFIKAVKEGCQFDNRNYDSLFIRREDNEFIAGSNYEGYNSFIHYNGKWFERESWSGEDRLVDHPTEDIIGMVISMAWLNL